MNLIWPCLNNHRNMHTHTNLNRLHNVSLTLMQTEMNHGRARCFLVLTTGWSHNKFSKTFVHMFVKTLGHLHITFLKISLFIFVNLLQIKFWHILNMLDPSIPWLASGYKNFQSEDITKTHSYDDITKLYHINQEDFIKKELRSSTPELRQRRRVKSATVQRQLHRNSGNERPPRPRPKTALGLATVKNYDGVRSQSPPFHLGGSPTRPGSSPTRLGGRSRTRPKSSQSYHREKVGCYDYTSEHPLPQSFIETPNKPRPKSAILIKHRPSSLDRKSVSLVERQYYKERMTYV